MCQSEEFPFGQCLIHFKPNDDIALLVGAQGRKEKDGFVQICPNIHIRQISFGFGLGVLRLFFGSVRHRKSFGGFRGIPAGGPLPRGGWYRIGHPFHHHRRNVPAIHVKLKIKPVSFECTYHDSCYIGRYMDIFEEPREVLKAAGGNIKEMSKNRLESFCCGAGGGRIIAEESIGE
ncbi:MAG: (Fe-S)-binding protein, partial [Bacteroidetes bacterium]